MDRVLFACDHANFRACLDLANRHRAGLEIQTFAQPQVLDGGWRELLAGYRSGLAGFAGELALHGAFYDLASGSPDPLVRAVARQRYLHNLEIAHALGARTVVFHLNFLPQVDSAGYRASWVETQVLFWRELAEHAARLDVIAALENLWEPDPGLIAEIVDRVDCPQVRACVDVGHVHLYSKVPFETWLAQLGARVVYVHLNNNPGTVDVHRGLDEGAIDYRRILPLLRALDPRPAFSLEIDNVPAIERSLGYFDLPQ